jgi:GTP diphosphokinase / guanosine-3',5'-bis(diphosphate) 3'-diphosphatase
MYTKMNSNKELLKAIELAVYYHGEQLDKVGQLYILHPIAVMQSVETIDEKIVAIMHDVLEDTNMVWEELYGERYFEIVKDTSELRFRNPIFSQEVVYAIIAITKKQVETNKEYWTRVKTNPLALKVKLADIAHNSSPARLDKLDPDEADYLRKKYKKAVEFLTS